MDWNVCRCDNTLGEPGGLLSRLHLRIIMRSLAVSAITDVIRNTNLYQLKYIWIANIQTKKAQQKCLNKYLHGKADLRRQKHIAVLRNKLRHDNHIEITCDETGITLNCVLHAASEIHHMNFPHVCYQYIKINIITLQSTHPTYAENTTTLQSTCIRDAEVKKKKWNLITACSECCSEEEFDVLWVKLLYNWQLLINFAVESCFCLIKSEPEFSLVRIWIRMIQCPLSNSVLKQKTFKLICRQDIRFNHKYPCSWSLHWDS